MKRIFKCVLLFLLLGINVVAFSQEVEISKSQDIIVLQGKSYYLHTVMPGQTLFSICKAYGVNVAEVRVLNNKTDNSLRLYEVLRIPYIEPFVQQDDKFYYHKVQQGETIYSIARLYNIKPKRLLKFNEKFQKESLAIGVVVKLPLNEIDLSFVQATAEKNQVVEAVQAVKTEHGAVVDSVQNSSIEEKRQMVMEGIQGNSLHDTLPVQLREDMLGALDKAVSDSSIQVALLLPLSANAYPKFHDSIVGEEVVFSSRTEMFVSFYEGMLLAVDSLKSRGYHIDLHVFDTERKVEKAMFLAESLNHLQPDLIIGPVYASVYKVLAEQLMNKRVPLIYPLSTRGEEFGGYPNFVQVNASMEGVAERMIQWVDKQRTQANVLYLDIKGTEEPEAFRKVQFRERVLAMDGVRSFVWDMEKVPLDSLRVLLVPNCENVILLPEDKEGDINKILPLLSALTDGFQLSVLGLPEWQTFASIDHETFYKLNTKILSNSYVDYSSEAAKRVVENYRKYFSTEPSTFVFKAYDMGIYFIELVAKYGERALEALEYEHRTIGCSQFRFRNIPFRLGKENNGFYIVHLASDYSLKLSDL